jgi:hypothetical protein
LVEGPGDPGVLVPEDAAHDLRRDPRLEAERGEGVVTCSPTFSGTRGSVEDAGRAQACVVPTESGGHPFLPRRHQLEVVPVGVGECCDPHPLEFVRFLDHRRTSGLDALELLCTSFVSKFRITRSGSLA